MLIFSVVACGDGESSGGDELPYYSNQCVWTAWNRLAGQCWVSQAEKGALMVIFIYIVKKELLHVI